MRGEVRAGRREGVGRAGRREGVGRRRCERRAGGAIGGRAERRAWAEERMGGAAHLVGGELQHGDHLAELVRRDRAGVVAVEDRKGLDDARVAWLGLGLRLGVGVGVGMRGRVTVRGLGLGGWG